MTYGFLRDEAGRLETSLPPIHYCSHSLGPLLAITEERCLSVTALHTGSCRSSDSGRWTWRALLPSRGRPSSS